jgi:hypothetical protein
VSLDLLKKSVGRTTETVLDYTQNVMKKKLAEQIEANRQTLKHYEESIYALKRIEVHQILKKDGKQTLMEFYYDETQMNKWRDSCKRTEESLKGKVEKFDKDIGAFKIK